MACGGEEEREGVDFIGDGDGNGSGVGLWVPEGGRYRGKMEMGYDVVERSMRIMKGALAYGMWPATVAPF